MKEHIEKTCIALDELSEAVISSWTIDDPLRDHYGWHHPALTRHDLADVASNLSKKLKKLQLHPSTHFDIKKISTIPKKLKSMHVDTLPYMFNGHGHQAVPAYLSTIAWVATLFDEETDWETLQDKNILPRTLVTRLRNTKTRLDSIDESNETLLQKITLINEAHEAAENLPTDLEELREARRELKNLIESAQKELAKAKEDIKVIREEAINFKNLAKLASDGAEALKNETQKVATEASELVAQCDDALQITTTQGLAAGFDQKANELKKSIWVWIAGLLVALVAGAWIGAERVDAFTTAIGSNLTAGQAILHTIMSIFSIGGPIWLAWISTQQINQRFKLSEDYSYKATVAKSFTGFKKFAERFDSHTEERLFNSTLDRFDEAPLRLIEGKDYNSPWHEFTDSETFKKAVETFPTLAKEAGKFASSAALKGKPAVRQPTSKKDITDR